MRRVIFAAAAIGVLAGAAGLVAQQALTRRDSQGMERKLLRVLERGAGAPAGAPTPVRTSFTEREINAYLKFDGAAQLPEGVKDPQVTMVGAQRVSGQAVVDLDAVRKSKPRTWLDPASYLMGTVEVKATGTLRTSDGSATFQLDSATVGAVPIPRSVFQELVDYFLRTPEMPDGVQLDKPFPLPDRIREVQIQRGAATIVQQ